MNKRRTNPSLHQHLHNMALHLKEESKVGWSGMEGEGDLKGLGKSYYHRKGSIFIFHQNAKKKRFSLPF